MASKRPILNLDGFMKDCWTHVYDARKELEWFGKVSTYVVRSIRNKLNHFMDVYDEVVERDTRSVTASCIAKLRDYENHNYTDGQEQTKMLLSTLTCCLDKIENSKFS